MYSTAFPLYTFGGQMSETTLNIWDLKSHFNLEKVVILKNVKQRNVKSNE